MYKVIKLFADLKDGNHVYKPGDIFPRNGVTVSDDRIAELAGSNNKQGTPLIKAEEAPAEVPEVVEVAEEAPGKKTTAKKAAKDTARK